MQTAEANTYRFSSGICRDQSFKRARDKKLYLLRTLLKNARITEGRDGKHHVSLQGVLRNEDVFTVRKSELDIREIYVLRAADVLPQSAR